MAEQAEDEWVRYYRSLVMEMDIVSNAKGQDVIRNSGIPNQCSDVFIALLSAYEDLGLLHSYVSRLVGVQGPIPISRVRRFGIAKTAIDDANKTVSIELASFVECLRENPLAPKGVEVDEAGRPYIEGIPQAIHELREAAVGSGDVDLLAERQDKLPPKPAKKVGDEEE